MNNPKVSIIIPVYNVEKYIRKCLNSILNQSFTDFEIILIDDGSKDNSGYICDEYVLKDKRISVIHTKNKGSGPARNEGIERAKGEFLMFIDPDDWLDSDMIEVMYRLITNQNLDLVICPDRNYYIEDENIIKIEEEKGTLSIYNTKEEVRDKFSELCTNSLSHAPHNKIYRAKIIHSNNIKFPNLRRSQDIVFNNRYFENIKSLAITGKAYYNYRVNNLEAQAVKIPDNMLEIYTLLFNDYIDMHLRWGILNDNKRKILSSSYITNVCYCIHNLFNPNRNKSFKYKYKYINDIIKNDIVISNIKYAENTSVFVKMISKLITYRQPLLIIFLYKMKFAIRQIV